MLTSVARHSRWFCLIIGTLKIILGTLTSLLFISTPLNSRNVPLVSLILSSWWFMAELSSPLLFFHGLKGLRCKKGQRNGRGGRSGEGETWGGGREKRQHRQKPLKNYSWGIRAIDVIKPGQWGTESTLWSYLSVNTQRSALIGKPGGVKEGWEHPDD